MAVSRRGMLSSLVTAAAIPALPALAVSARTGMSSPFTGEYDDANHPGCLRSVKVVGAKLGADGRSERFPTAYIKGTDQKEGEKACSGTPELADVWSLTGKVSEAGDEIFVDFSPKGGPKAVAGKLDTFGGVEGILFPVSIANSRRHSARLCLRLSRFTALCLFGRMATSGPRSRTARRSVAPSWPRSRAMTEQCIFVPYTSHSVDIGASLGPSASLSGAHTALWYSMRDAISITPNQKEAHTLTETRTETNL